MTKDPSTELFHQGGKTSHSVHLHANPDGSIRLDALDMGEDVTRIFGGDDYEYWVDVPVTALPQLVLSLLRAKYLGRHDAVDEFRKFCQTESIEHTWDSWV